MQWSGRAESAGAAALWACDHLFWHGPSIECLTALAFAAAGTERCIVGSGVLQLPLRSAPAVAKAAASLEALSGGRMVLGLGVGQHDGEYEAAGVDYRSRGRALDRAIPELRRIWGRTEGRYPQLPSPGSIPLWIGGSSERARRRAATLGEGWMPLFIPPKRLREQFDRLGEDTEEAGRPAEAVARALMVFLAVGGDNDAADRGARWMASLYGLPAERLMPHLIAGEAARCADSLLSINADGADHIALFVADDEPLGHFEQVTEALSAVGT